MKHDLKELVRDAIAAGFQVGRTQKQHLKFVAPNGTTIYGSGTPSDYRAVRNMRAKLRRVGLDDRQRSQGASA